VVHRPRTPPLDLPCAALLGIALCVLAVSPPARWPAVLLLDVASRIALDPDHRYYAAGAFACRRLGPRPAAEPLPVWTAGRRGHLFATAGFRCHHSVHAVSPWPTVVPAACTALLIPDGRRRLYGMRRTPESPPPARRTVGARRNALSTPSNLFSW